MWIWWLAGAIVLVIFILAALGSVMTLLRKRAEARAKEAFHASRPELQDQYFRAASASGKPKGLRWKECQWESEVEFVRHRQTHELAALVSLTICFEAIEGGDMEGVSAVGLPRNASAVFFYHNGRWSTLGKTIFNKNPDEAAEHFRNLYVRLDSAAG